MNRIRLSECQQFVDLWHNGKRILSVHIGGRLHEAVGKAREYIRQWTGDDNPEIDPALAAKLDELLQCPECGSTNVRFWRDREAYATCWECSDCGKDGADHVEDVYGCMAVPWGFLL